MPSRLPRLAVAAWTVAGLTVVALALAVAHYLRASGVGHLHTADALTRGGTQSPLRPLFGSALFTAWHLDAVAVAVLVLAGATYLTGAALVPVRTPGVHWPVRRTA